MAMTTHEVTVHHGTSAAFADRLLEGGLLAGPTGGPFVTRERRAAVEYAFCTVRAAARHGGWSRHGLLVSAEVRECDLIAWGGRLGDVFRDSWAGYELARELRPDELTLEVIDFEREYPRAFVRRQLRAAFEVEATRSAQFLGVGRPPMRAIARRRTRG